MALPRPSARPQQCLWWRERPGPDRWTSSCPAWALPLGWATCGASLTSATRMEEVSSMYYYCLDTRVPGYRGYRGTPGYRGTEGTGVRNEGTVQASSMLERCNTGTHKGLQTLAHCTYSRSIQPLTPTNDSQLPTCTGSNTHRYADTVTLRHSHIGKSTLLHSKEETCKEGSWAVPGRLR